MVNFFAPTIAYSLALNPLKLQDVD
jgi:hypothetical protein